MRSPVGRKLIKLTGGLAVVVASFWTTLKILDYWSTPADPNASTIHITEATYGKSCEGFVPPPGHTNQVKLGNATAAVAQACDNRKESCPFTVEAAKLVDPASGCGKDFMVSWRCGEDQTVHRFYVQAEADGKIALVICRP